MDYKEKYEKALERAKYLKENTDGVGAKDVSMCFEEIFPELKESEDERIRRELIRDIDIAMPAEIAQRYIAWLEKQGVQKNTCQPNNTYGNVKFPFRARVKSSDAIITIQGGQLSMDGKKWIKYQSDSEDGYRLYKPDELELVYDVEQKSGWSEVDEKILDSIIEDVMPIGECPDYPTDEEREYYYEGDRKVEWLKSIKERIKGE